MSENEEEYLRKIMGVESPKSSGITGPWTTLGELHMFVCMCVDVWILCACMCVCVYRACACMCVCISCACVCIMYVCVACVVCVPEV